MSAYTYLGDGIKCKEQTVRFGPRKGQRVTMYYFEVWYEGKRYTEKGGTTERQAIKKQETRLNEIEKGKYLPPRERRRQARQVTKEREQFRFDVASAAFLEDCAKDYANPKQIQRDVARLKEYFGSRYLDEITRADLKAYMQQRKCDLRFRGQRKMARTNSLRPAQLEIQCLSQIYGFLQDEGHEIVNPCLRPPGRRAKRKKAERYVVTHVPIIPQEDQLGAIFAAAEADGEQAAVFVTLAAYTGGRPESDLLRLNHGDVEIVGDRVRSTDGSKVLDWISFRDPKTPAGKRRMPLHPFASAALKRIMMDEPTSTSERATWAKTPIFRCTRKQGKRWTKYSYTKPWARIIANAETAHPRLAGMWIRDLRKWFRTNLTDALVPEPTIKYLMGHARDVSMSYHVPAERSLREAILTLPEPVQVEAALASQTVAQPAVETRLQVAV